VGQGFRDGFNRYQSSEVTLPPFATPESRVVQSLLTSSPSFSGDDTKVHKLSGSRSCAMLARSAIRAETRFFKVPRGGEGHCLQKSSASGAKIRQLSGRFSLWSDDQILSAVSAIQSARIHARRPNSASLGSVESDNSDTFVSSPLKWFRNRRCYKGRSQYFPLLTDPSENLLAIRSTQN
jgi:hypothetical protein